MVPARKRISLGSSITVFVLLIGLLTGALGLGSTYWQAIETRRTTIGLYFQELARQSADKVGLLLAKEVEWVGRLGVLPQAREAARLGKRLAFDTPELRRWREEQQQYFRSLAVVNREGRLVGGVTSEATREHYGQQPWWPMTVGQGRPWVSDLRVDERGRGYWEVAVPIFNDEGRVLGVLKVALGTDELFASILRTGVGKTGHVMLLNESGEVLACPILLPSFHTRTDALSGGRDRGALSGVEASWVQVRDDTHGGRNGIVGISPVRLPAPIVQERVWYILVRQAPGETYGPTFALLGKLAGFWVGAIGLIALFGAHLARRIVRPLEELVGRVRLLGEGQLIQPSAGAGPMTRGEFVEVETLTDSFNRLAGRLESASRETQRYVQELEKANRELASSEEHYRTLWDHAADTMLIVDSAGRILDANRRAELKLGRCAGELLDALATDLFADRDRSRFQTLLEHVLVTGKEESATDIHMPAAAGASFIMELQMVPMERAGTEKTVLLQLRDVTDKKLLEQQLLRTERLASLSQFASMFAHDIRNPLAGMKKTLELLSDRTELQAEPLGRLFMDLQFTTELLLGMINDMLDVYQESYSGLPLVPSRFPVGALLQEVVRLFKSEARARQASLQLNLTEEVTLVGDRRRLQRVGINLVHNALKYSPPGGLVRLSVRIVGGPESRAWELGVGAPFLLFQVQDQGPGVDPEELPHIFEMFFRKKDGRDVRIGRGLGLHFCRLVVEAHHGRIWASNEALGGAVFSVALPIRGAEACRSGL